MIRKSFVSFLALFILAVPVFSQDKFVVPNQKVIGAEEAIPANEIIVLKVTPINERPKYLQDVSYSWSILTDSSAKTETVGVMKEKKNIVIYPDNTTVVFGRGDATKIQALLVINYLYTVKDKDGPEGKITEVGQKSSGIIFTDVKLKNPPVPVPPKPVPVPPAPSPDLPVGKFNLAKPAYELAMKVTVNSRVNGADILVTKMSGISSSIRAGALTDPTDILTKLKTANNSGLQSLSIPLSDWDSYGVGIQQQLSQLYNSNKLNVASDYADALDEIVTGLRKVK